MYKTWDDLAKEQKIVARLLKNHLQLNRLNHAYIFEGSKGTKKAEIALFFTKAILCKNLDEDGNPCHHCTHCKRVDHGTHPNVLIVKPKGKMIKKEQIKDLIQEFSMTSLEVGPRVNIIYQAEKFNASSANALLKTMEEPGEDIYQIMLTENIQSLLPTIRSRGEVIHFMDLDRLVIRESLQAKGVEPSYANPISQYTSDLSAAQEIANDDMKIEMIDLVIDVFDAMQRQKQSAVIRFLENGGVVLSDASRTEFFLNFMILFQKDIIQTLLEHDDVCFLNHHQLIKSLASMIDLEVAQDQLEAMLKLTKRLHYNINLPLAMNHLLVVLERGYTYGT
jgi:DNA polymerase-3 subunit delta'